jgi:hypothetical protein
MDTAPATGPYDLVETYGGLVLPVIARLIHGARAALAQQGEAPLSARLCGRVLRQLILPAEALLRRIIHFMALSVPWPEPAASGLPLRRLPPARQDKPAASPRPPRFRLTEPQARPGQAPLALARISVPGLTPPPALPARKPADPATLAARLHRRLEALGAAFDAPGIEAARLVRRLARQGQRALRLAFLKPPGRASRALDPYETGLLDDLNREVFSAAGAAFRPDTS